MGKRVYLLVNKNDQQYRIYMNDIKTIHRNIKKPRPLLPSYDKVVKEKKWEGFLGGQKQATTHDFLVGNHECKVHILRRPQNLAKSSPNF